MSQEHLDNEAQSPVDKRRSTVPEILPHQQSFEKRYSTIIHRQILETSINKEALQRQLNAFFPCSRSSSRDSVDDNTVEGGAAAVISEHNPEEEAVTAEAGEDVAFKILDKIEKAEDLIEKTNEIA